MKTPPERRWRRDQRLSAPLTPPSNVNGDGRRRRRPRPTPAAEIARLRTAQCLTQADLAAKAGVTQQAIAKLEQVGSNPTVATLERVATALGFRVVVTFQRVGPCQCCSRGDEYNGYGSDGPTSFTCPRSCGCHD